VKGVEGLLAEMGAMRQRIEAEACRGAGSGEHGASSGNTAFRKALEDERRAGKRQAAPFSRGMRKPNPKKPGRKPGGSRTRREVPTPQAIALAAHLNKVCGVSYERIAEIFRHVLVCRWNARRLRGHYCGAGANRKRPTGD